jgi:GT2 family glycosyltransferase
MINQLRKWKKKGYINKEHKMNSKVGIVLVNYNGEKFQAECINTIKNMTYKNYEIIVIDNNSTDNSIKILKNRYPDVKVIETGENGGVAKGNNIGIKYALENGCEYILLLNNDTEVDNEMLNNMMKKTPIYKLVTCKMYYYKPDDMIWCAGGKINWTKAITEHFHENENDIGQANNSMTIEYTPTCCLLIHKSVFEEIGLMDESYFMYYDDTDFIVRCKKAGYKIWYESTASLWHKVSSSSGGSESKIAIYYNNRNRLYFINKHYKIKVIVKAYYYITRILKIIKYMLNGSDIYKVIKKAIYDSNNNNMYFQDLSNLQ